MFQRVLFQVCDHFFSSVFVIDTGKAWRQIQRQSLVPTSTGCSQIRMNTWFHILLSPYTSLCRFDTLSPRCLAAAAAAISMPLHILIYAKGKYMTAAVFPFTYDANPRHHYDAASALGISGCSRLAPIVGRPPLPPPQWVTRVRCSWACLTSHPLGTVASPFREAQVDANTRDNTLFVAWPALM